MWFLRALCGLVCLSYRDAEGHEVKKLKFWDTYTLSCYADFLRNKAWQKGMLLPDFRELRCSVNGKEVSPDINSSSIPYGAVILFQPK
ncbi:MAG: hypothetical protein Q8Q13_00315 [bacterium]|nr:hypothetical protein [bacterium]